MAYSYLAEVTYEVHDKPASERAAEAGVKDADKAISINGKVADYYRVLGTLCGQVIPANPIMGALAYGKRAKEALDKAIEMDPKSARACHVAHGVGFTSTTLRPRVSAADRITRSKTISRRLPLDPKNAEAYLWLGVAYAKGHQSPQGACEAFTKSLAARSRSPLDERAAWQSPPVRHIS